MTPEPQKRTMLWVGLVLVVLILLCAVSVGMWRFEFFQNKQMSQPASQVGSTTPISTSTLTQWVPLSNKQNSDYTESAGVIVCKGAPIAGADASSFFVSAATSSINDGLYAHNSVDAFAKDKNHVYECHNAGVDSDPQYGVPGAAIITGADPATFTLIFDSAGYFASFAKDTNNVYAVNWGNANILQGVDPNTFVSIDTTADPSDSFFKDKDNVYTWWGLIAGADPGTFKVLLISTTSRAVYGKDATHVYYANGRGTQLISGADPTTFLMLGEDGSYAKDAAHVYELGVVQTGVVSVIPGADSATFQLVFGQSTYDAQDKNHKYQYGHIVE